MKELTEFEENMLAACRTTLVWLRSLPEDVLNRNPLEAVLAALSMRLTVTGKPPI